MGIKMTIRNRSRKGICLLGLLLVTCIPCMNLAAEEAGVKRIELVISEREVQIQDKTIRLTMGESVEMVWSSDEAGELHLHGYDINFEVSPDAPTIVTFTAHATGRFPVTSHGFGGETTHGHKALLYIEVYPE